jgi:hypothetical protein
MYYLFTHDQVHSIPSSSSSEFWGHSTCFFARGFNPCRSKRTPWQSSSICVLDKWRSGFKTEEPGA